MSNNEWPAEGLEYLGYCPVCGSKPRALQYADLTDSLYSAPGLWTLYRCMECQVRYLDPRPNAKTIKLAYSNYHTHGAVHHNGTPNNPLRKVKLALKNGYLNNVWNTSLQPAFPFLARLISTLYPNWMALYHRQAMRDLPGPARGELLDIGCGGGSFLRLAKAVGWSVHGVDVDEKALAVARAANIDVALGGIELFDGQKELFDVITLSHVIEHVHDPNIVLKACWRLLKPGGIFWIEAPNFDSYGRKLFDRNWRGLEPPRHLVLFNTANMSRLLAQVGFSNIRHAGWMPQLKPMYQASKNIKNGDTSNVKNMNVYEKIKVALADRNLKKDATGREYFTFISNK